MAETRYTDDDLKEFEALIQDKLEVARENYDELQRALSLTGMTIRRMIRRLHLR
jgi:hypothetical protein